MRKISVSLFKSEEAILFTNEFSVEANSIEVSCMWKILWRTDWSAEKISCFWMNEYTPRVCFIIIGIRKIRGTIIITKRITQTIKAEIFLFFIKKRIFLYTG